VVCRLCHSTTFIDATDHLRSISDARISFRVLKGPIVFLGFVEPEELKHWAKMELPRLPELVELVEDMQTEEIGANFQFKVPSETPRPQR
jgi:hypothetical protein